MPVFPREYDGDMKLGEVVRILAEVERQLAGVLPAESELEDAVAGCGRIMRMPAWPC